MSAPNWQIAPAPCYIHYSPACHSNDTPCLCPPSPSPPFLRSNSWLVSLNIIDHWVNGPNTGYRQQNRKPQTLNEYLIDDRIWYIYYNHRPPPSMYVHKMYQQIISILFTFQIHHNPEICWHYWTRFTAIARMDFVFGLRLSYWCAVWCVASVGTDNTYVFQGHVSTIFAYIWLD